MERLVCKIYEDNALGRLPDARYAALDAQYANEFVEKILVHERDRKGSIETTQVVEVYFNFVGKYIPPAFRDVELTSEEQEAIRKKEELKDKRHQAYLRRKAIGRPL